MYHLFESMACFLMLQPAWFLFTQVCAKLVPPEKLAALPIAVKIAGVAVLAIPAFFVAMFFMIALGMLCRLAVEEPGTTLNLSYDSIWTGRTMREKISREFGRLGMLVASALLATIIWLCLGPQVMPWNSGRHAMLFCGVWQLALIPVIWIAVGGVTFVRHPLRLAYYRAVNSAFTRLSRK